MNIFFLSYIGLIGVFLGSFLSAWVFREHENISICKGRSFCPECKHLLAGFDLVPLFSFLFLQGKCRYCQEQISYRYFFTEFLTGIIFVFLGIFYHASFDFLPVQFFISLFASVFLLAIFISDFLYLEIPFSFTIFPAFLLFISNFFLHFEDWKSLVFGGILGGAFFAFQFLLSKGKWIGGGDIWLGLFMGILLGFQKTLLALSLAYIFGAIVGIFLLLTKNANRKTAIHFGTFLSLATFVAMLWGEKIIRWYLDFV